MKCAVCGTDMNPYDVEDAKFERDRISKFTTVDFGFDVEVSVKIKTRAKICGRCISMMAATGLDDARINL